MGAKSGQDGTIDMSVVPSAAMSTIQITVGTGLTGLLSANVNRKGAIISNSSASTIYIGQGAITPTTGLPIPAGTMLKIDAGALYQGIIYAIVASGTEVVGVAEFT